MASNAIPCEPGSNFSTSPPFGTPATLRTRYEHDSFGWVFGLVVFFLLSWLCLLPLIKLAWVPNVRGDHAEGNAIPRVLFREGSPPGSV